MMHLNLIAYFSLAVLCSAWWMDFTSKPAKKPTWVMLLVRVLSIVISYGFGIAFAISLCNLYQEKPGLYVVIFCTVAPMGIGMLLSLIIGRLSRLRRNHALRTDVPAMGIAQ